MNIAFIHAKGISERVPNKNLKTLGDRPLFCHALSIARKCKRIDKVIIDSENKDIRDIGLNWGADECIFRPPELSTNETTGDDLAYWQASNYKDSDICIQIVPTSPFIKPESIDEGIFILEDAPSLMSVVGSQQVSPYRWAIFTDGTYEPTYYTLNDKIPNSQDIIPLLVETTGLYIFRTTYALKYQKRLHKHLTYLMKLSPLESVDINTEEDFEFAEIIWRGLHA